MQSFVDLLQYLLWTIFCLINFLIIQKDIQDKIIPNKYLIYLCLLSIPMILIWWINFSVFWLLFSLIVTFIISFILYYFWVWSAWDAKYLLVLLLFIPQIWIFYFASNVIIATIIYLCIHFSFLLIIKWIFIWKREELFVHQIFNSIWEEHCIPILNFFKNPHIVWFLKAINTINVFLSIFVLVRLSRFLVLDSVEVGTSTEFQEQYMIYIILWMMIFILLSMFWVRILWWKIVQFISEKKWYSTLSINIFWSNILFILVAIFIYYDYKLDPDALIANMKIIFTFYIAIFILVRCLMYLYKFTFIEMEKKPIKVKDLKEGDIIYKKFLVKTLLPLIDWLWTDEFKKEREIIEGIKNKLTKKEVKALKKVYKTFSTGSNIAIIDTFAFSPYIFIGFLISVYFGWSLIQIIAHKILSFI